MIAMLAVGLLTFGGLAAVQQATAPAASAAVVPINSVEARIANNVGTNAAGTTTITDDANCLRYAPVGGTSATAWVGTSAWTYAGHGRSGSRCPSNLDLSSQSVLGFQPAAVSNVQTGTVFNLGMMEHRNNPVAGLNTDYFKGDLQVRIDGATTLTFPWKMWETPNSTRPCPVGPANVQCEDQTTFTAQISPTDITGSDGLPYRLVVWGFAPAANGACPAVPTGAPVNEFLTAEGVTTSSCLYASMEQRRSVQVVKQVVSPYATAPAANFAFTSTSTLDGSPWKAGFSLAAGDTVTRDASSGEQIVITEQAQSAPWSLTNVACVEGTGANARAVAGLQISGGSVTIPKGATADTVDRLRITCTYTNTYTPTATLTLTKAVISTGQPAPTAKPADWTLTAAGEGPVAGRTLSGPSDAAAVTARQVVAGTYQLSEIAGDTANTGGYAQDGAWVCTGGVTPTAAGRITLTQGQTTTCTVTNRYQTGTLEVAKTVTGPAGGYLLGTGKTFAATYACTVGTRTVNGSLTLRPGSAVGTAGAVASVPNLPAGASCVVTEVAPTGSTDLANGSFVWGAPAYGPSSTVTIPTGGAARVDISNPITQQSGALTITKAVTPRAGTPATGYVGTRTFPIAYACVIDAQTVRTGTVDLAAGGSQTITGIPSTALCTVSETQAAVAGDFADASYRWDGVDYTQAAAIEVNGTVTAAVTNRFVRDDVSLTIAKTVIGEGYTPGDTFTIDYGCGDVSGAVTIAGGASETVSVPAGVACTVSEQAGRPALTGGHVWGDASYAGLSGGTVTVPRGETRTVTVTNPTQIGFNRIQITKSIPNFADRVQTGTTFPVAVSCDRPAQGATADYTATFTFTSPLTGAQQTPYLPIGTACSVVESGQPTDATALPDASYAWSAPAYEGLTDGVVVVPASSTPASVTVVNDITRVLADLTIVKSVSNTTAAAVTAPFTGDWSCTYAGEQAVTGTWTAPAAGGTATRTGAAQLLVGSICSVTENTPMAPVAGDASYVWATQLPQPVTVSAAGATATVTNTLTRTSGSFSVSKSVTGGTAGTEFPDAPFAFDWSCTPPSGAALSGALDISAGSSASPDEAIPAGSRCVVTERTGALPTPNDPYRWSGVTFAVSGAAGADVTDGIAFTTPADGAAVAVAATNTIAAQTGSVSATKRVTNLDGGFVGTADDRLFPLTLSCTTPGAGAPTTVGTTTVAADGTATWSDIPLGSSCAVQEGQILPGGLLDASFTWSTVSYDPTSVTVTDADRTPAITVTNTLARVYGPIELTKTFDDGGYTGVVPTDRQYDGTWVCTYGGSTVAAGTWSGTGSSAGTPATLVATSGAVDRIPLTSSCTATESDLAAPSTDGSYVWKTPVIGSVDAVASVGSTITVTNGLARDTTTVRVTKTLTGATAGYAPADGFAGFPIGIVCAAQGAQLDDADATRLTAEVAVVPGAQPVDLLTDVPAGWTCRVTEAVVADQLVDDSYAWGTPAYTHDGTSGATFTVTGETTVDVANPITRVTDGLIVRKSLDGVPAGVVADEAAFDGTYTCVYAPDTDRTETFTGTWSVTGAGVASTSPDPAMPLGTTCDVAETTPSADLLSDVSWAWSDPAVTATRAAVSAGGPADLTVANGVHRVYAGLEVTKAYTGVDGAFADTLTVSGAWSCTLDGTDVASGTWTLPAGGGSVTVADPADARIPAGASCAVTEDTLDAADLVDASYAWDQPVIGGDVVTAADTVAGITVTNATHRVTGGFTVDKVVNRTAAVPSTVPGPTRTYQGTWACVYDGETRTGTWGPIVEGGVWTSPADILLTSVCSVTAQDDPGAPNLTDDSYVWTQHQLGAPVTVDVDAPRITVPSDVDRLTGSFGVTKAVLGDVAGVAPTAVYGFDWQCVDQGGAAWPAAGPGTFELTAGGLWDGAGEIPDGSVCTVTETTLPATTHPSYTWSTTTSAAGADPVDGSTATITVDGAASTAVIAFANTLTRTVGSYAVTKTADPASGSTVKPGDRITYTVTVTPGAAGFVDDVVVRDDLASVVANAAFDDTSITASQGTASRTGSALTWDVGRVDAGEPLTLVYAATVDADAWNVTIRNAVTATGETPPTSCEHCSTEHVTPAWSIEKTSTPGSGATVVAGDVITYTLTARNTTERATMSGAVATDDLSAVVAYGALGDLPDGLTRTGDVLTWAVPDLAPEASASVSYTLTVGAGHDGVTIQNGVAPGPGGTCVGECSTEHRTPKWSVAKTSDPGTGSAVLPGASITYTLTAANEGETPVTDATVIDDLSDVLANADLVGTLPDGLVLDGSTLTWTVPELAVGETAVVRYTVTVDGDARGATLRNAIITRGPGGSCDTECETVHVVPIWTLEKSSDPGSGATVAPGQTITYTLTVRNESATALRGALALDDLSGVLPGATLQQLGDGLTRTGDVLTWAVPEVAAGASVSVSYSVLVKQGFDRTIRNVVTPGGTPGGACVESCTTTHVVPPPLPVTGADGPWTLAGLAGLIAAAGVLLLVVARRRRV